MVDSKDIAVLRAQLALHDAMKAAHPHLFCRVCGHKRREHDPMLRCQDGWCDCTGFQPDVRHDK
jgi:hypothetical protein